MGQQERPSDKKPKALRRALSGGGLGSGIVIAWAWNAVFPEHPMPTEVAAGIGGGLVLLGRWVSDLVEEMSK